MKLITDQVLELDKFGITRNFVNLAKSCILSCLSISTSMMLKWNFRRGVGVGVNLKNPPWEEVWIFSGTTDANAFEISMLS